MYRPTWFRGAWKSICRVHALEQKGDRGWMQRVMGCRINPVKKDCPFLPFRELPSSTRGKRSSVVWHYGFSMDGNVANTTLAFKISTQLFLRSLIRSRNVNLEHCGCSSWNTTTTRRGFLMSMNAIEMKIAMEIWNFLEIPSLILFVKMVQVA